MANEAVVNIKANNKALDKGLDESEQLVKKFATGVKLAAAGIAGAFAVSAIKNVLAGWISDASAAEDATVKLEAIVKATGGTAGYTADQLAQMADEIEKMTGVQAESVQQAQALLLAFDNVRGDQFQRATELATDLAVTMGTDVSGAARVLGKALDDPVDAVNALARAGVDFTDAQKEMIKEMAASGDVVGAQNVILDALEGKVGGVAEAMGQTFSGKVAILGAKFGDLGETIAGVIIPYIEALLPAAEIAVAGFQEILNILAELIGTSEEVETSFAEMVVDAFRFVVTAGVDSFSYLMGFMETWSEQSARAATSVYLSFVTLFEDLKHWFTVVVPEYIGWFGENWSNILTDVSTYTSTVFSNMWTNIKNFFSNVWKWLNGEEVSFEWVGLTEGFKATTQQLPEIAERALSDTEQYLQSSIRTMDKNIASTFDKRQQEGRAFIDKIFARDKKARTDFETNEKTERRKLGKETEEKVKEEKAKEEKAASSSAAAAAKESTAGTLVGIEELSRRIEEASKASVDVAALAQPATVQGAAVQQQADQASVMSVMVTKLDEQLKAAERLITAVENLNIGVV